MSKRVKRIGYAHESQRSHGMDCGLRIDISSQGRLMYKPRQYDHGIPLFDLQHRKCILLLPVHMSPDLYLSLYRCDF